jgi:hypothetical protein
VRLPSSERLAYLKLALETVLLILIVPLAIYTLMRNPDRAIDHAIDRGMKGAS